MKQSNLRFTNPIVTKFDFLVNKQYIKSETVAIQNSFEVEISKNMETNEAIIQLNILVGEKEFSDDIPFYVDMTIGAKFLWDDVYDDETLQDLLSKNAPALLLGYARPLIANMTSAGPMATYNVPFYNFIDN